MSIGIIRIIYLILVSYVVVTVLMYAVPYSFHGHVFIIIVYFTVTVAATLFEQNDSHLQPPCSTYWTILVNTKALDMAMEIILIPHYLECWPFPRSTQM